MRQFGIDTVNAVSSLKDVNFPLNFALQKLLMEIKNKMLPKTDS